MVILGSEHVFRSRFKKQTTFYISSTDALGANVCVSVCERERERDYCLNIYFVIENHLQQDAMKLEGGYLKIHKCELLNIRKFET